MGGGLSEIPSLILILESEVFTFAKMRKFQKLKAKFELNNLTRGGGANHIGTIFFK